MTTNTLSPIPTRTQLGGLIQLYPWTYQGQTVAVAYETLGSGTPVLLLPAFSTVSSRAEMAGIAQICASHFQVITLDWLGFGDSDRPLVQYGRSLYNQLLQDFVRDCLDQPVAVVAAGHAAGYAMQLAQNQPVSCSKLMLVAPTW
jgi:pimeloyl-ACP methyl ester carboxylesterase